MKESKTYIKRKGEKVTNIPQSVLVHHTGGTDKNPLEDTSHHTAEIIEQWHNKKGWSGIGYHYVIHKDGTIVKGRPEHVAGAHEPKVNSKSIGICLSGNFDATLPTKQQEKSLVALIHDITKRYDIKEIVPHRKYANKTCYGKKLSDTWVTDLLAIDFDKMEESKPVGVLLKDATLQELVDTLQAKIQKLS